MVLGEEIKFKKIDLQHQNIFMWKFHDRNRLYMPLPSTPSTSLPRSELPAAAPPKMLDLRGRVT